MKKSKLLKILGAIGVGIAGTFLYKKHKNKKCKTGSDDDETA